MSEIVSFVNSLTNVELILCLVFVFCFCGMFFIPKEKTAREKHLEWVFRDDK